MIQSDVDVHSHCIALALSGKMYSTTTTKNEPANKFRHHHTSLHPVYILWLYLNRNPTSNTLRVRTQSHTLSKGDCLNAKKYLRGVFFSLYIFHTMRMYVAFNVIKSSSLLIIAPTISVAQCPKIKYHKNRITSLCIYIWMYSLEM